MDTKIRILRLCFIFVLALLVFKIYIVAVIKGEEYSSQVKKQNFVSVSINNGRKNITDRNGKFITGVEKNKYIVAFSTEDNKENFRLSKILSEYTNSDEYKIYADLYKNKKAILKITKNRDLSPLSEYRNIKISEFSSRYISDYPAAAFVGYLSDGKGVSGLEAVYDEFLTSDSGNGFSVFSDSLKNLYGDIKIDAQNNDYTLQTTLNLDYQRICDEVLKNNGLPSAAVLIDVNNFEILAISSYPSFEQDNVGEYINRDDGTLSNRAFQAYDMGSIFKIVVTAAALENGYNPDEKIYNCTGKTSVHNQIFECHNIYGHGEQSITEAFMNSCNPAFIDIGAGIGYTKILNMAEKFGFGKNILNPMKLGCSISSLPDRNNYYLSDLANISIGQGGLNCSVVQGAVLSAVIANGGFFKYVDSVTGIADSDGNLIKEKNKENPERIISSGTAQKIRDMMILTCRHGTGSSAQIDFLGAGGKTGSAQTGWLVNNEFYQHAWFTGFFPAEKPEFALCVFIENGKSGSLTAAPVFKEIGEKILNFK